MFLKIDVQAKADVKEKFFQRLSQNKSSFQSIFMLDGEYLVLLNNSMSIDEITEWKEAHVIEKIYTNHGKRFFTTKQFKDQSIIRIKTSEFGNNHFPIIAGPCSVESYDQIFAIAELVKLKGGHGLRGGAFKPRTSPYDFQGLGVEGLQYLRQAADAFDLFVVTEIMDSRYLDDFVEQVDLIQVGARNMQNFPLLKSLGGTKKPILLKRGLAATYEELLYAAEYLMSHGNENIILCERGIRTFESYSRNTLDIAAVPILKDMTHLPIIVDPSHAVGIRKYVPNLAYASLAAGADGLMVEVHTHPEKSYSDAKQTICPNTFDTMVKTLKKIAPAFNRAIQE